MGRGRGSTMCHLPRCWDARYWYRNGDVYTGQFQENEKHGMGRLVYTGRKVPNDDEDGEVDEGNKGLTTPF